ncbi:MAG TPA: hypothetical protein VGQ93_04435 [Lysobacter sp.]|nr:hypothetical protein [Lysobacter sp.]
MAKAEVKVHSSTAPRTRSRALSGALLLAGSREVQRLIGLFAFAPDLRKHRIGHDAGSIRDLLRAGRCDKRDGQHAKNERQTYVHTTLLGSPKRDGDAPLRRDLERNNSLPQLRCWTRITVASSELLRCLACSFHG